MPIDRGLAATAIDASSLQTVQYRWGAAGRWGNGYRGYGYRGYGYRGYGGYGYRGWGYRGIGYRGLQAGKK